MTNVFAPRFDLVECSNEREREFIEVLHARAEVGGWFADSWPPRDDRLILTVDLSDSECLCVLRMLRVDYTGDAVLLGQDETYQLATDLDPANPGVVEVSRRPVGELAFAAAAWLEREMGRPIVRREWNRQNFRRREWLLADTGQALVFSDSANLRVREGLGPPDRVVHVLGRGEAPKPT